MSALTYVHRSVLPVVYALLPAQMNSREASALLLAIGLQESRFEKRRQLRGGPARGFWQFERIAVRHVLYHDATRPHAMRALDLMAEPETIEEVHAALEHNDVLAGLFARLNLWTCRKALPRKGEARASWDYYDAVWRPGDPHPETWPALFAQAWESL